MLLSSVTDAALAGRVVKGDGDAFVELARRYRDLIGYVTRWPMPGLEREDERQEALIALLEACRTFDPARGTFGAIATVRVRSRVWSARKRARSDRHRILTESLRLEHSARTDADTTRTLGETLPAGDATDPAVVIELRDELRQRAIRRQRERRERLSRRRRRSRPARRDRETEWPRRFSDADISTALGLVAQGKTLREAGAAVGASHPTVMRWLREAG
jgi:RNA polymerase sigma factor (sigma-70 family)